MDEVELFSGPYWDNAAAALAARREESAVHRARLPNGVRVWVITRYDEARAALADPRLSKDATRLSYLIQRQLADLGECTELSALFNRHMLFSDEPEHARLRGLVTAHFTRQRIEALRPRVEQISSALLDDLADDLEPVDLISRYAFLLPMTVICELLGVPADERGPFRDWTAALMTDIPSLTVPASRAMAAYFTDLITAKRLRPGMDLLSGLLGGDDGDRLTEQELIGTMFLVFVAGHETTTNLIGNAVRWLLEVPQSWRALGHTPELVSAAVEELLRFDPPVSMATHRFATRPVAYGGVSIPADEIVLISLIAANRDARQFDRADELDLVSEKRGHLSFGHGIHHCLGAMLGRLEAEVALRDLTGRFPGARLAVPGETLRRQHSAIMNGYIALPVLMGA